MDLDRFINSPLIALPYEAIEAIGLDDSGGDYPDRFPYTWGNLFDEERRRLRQAFPATVAIALADTGHFKFLAVAADEAGARDALMQAWLAHAELTGCDPEYLRPDEVSVLTGPLGQTWRDGSEFPRKDAS